MRIACLLCALIFLIIHSGKAADFDPIASLELNSFTTITETLKSAGFSNIYSASDSSKFKMRSNEFEFQVHFKDGRPVYGYWAGHNPGDFMILKEYLIEKGERQGQHLIIESEFNQYIFAIVKTSRPFPRVFFTIGKEKDNPEGFLELGKMQSDWSLFENYNFPSAEFKDRYEVVIKDIPSVPTRPQLLGLEPEEAEIDTEEQSKEDVKNTLHLERE